MAYIRLAVVPIIGVLQMCAANANASEEDGDPAKLFTADELQSAKNVGLSGTRLVEGKSFGLTVEEMIKFHEFKTKRTGPLESTFEEMSNICTVFDPEHKTATIFTSAQENVLTSVLDVTSFLLERDRAPFTRSTFCDYVRQPDLIDMEANAFGIQLTSYALISYIKMKAQKASGAERVQLAKEMCCAFKHQQKDLKIELYNLEYNGLADEKMKEFGERWNAFETANTMRTFNNVCGFLQQTESLTDECAIHVPVRTPVPVAV